jgi:aryl-alcohol dehydrogenase-like predicted oxidoreductase
MRVLAALDRIHEQTGAPLVAIALAWTSAQPGIVSTLASATSVNQFSELAVALELKLTPEQIRLLDGASAEAVPA